MTRGYRALFSLFSLVPKKICGYFFGKGSSTIQAGAVPASVIPQSVPWAAFDALLDQMVLDRTPGLADYENKN